MYHHLLWHRPAMREKKTLWESHKAGHSLHRCSVPGDFRTPGGKQWLSQWAQEKTSRTPVQRAPSLHGWSPKPICMEKHKRLYHKGKRSPEDNPRSHTSVTDTVIFESPFKSSIRWPRLSLDVLPAEKVVSVNCTVHPHIFTPQL